MVCLQTIIYVCMVIIQLLISIFVFKLPFIPESIIAPILITCLITFLCHKKFYTTSNIILGILIIFAIIPDVLGIMNPKIMNTLSKFTAAKESNSPDKTKLQQQLNYEIKNKIKNYV